MTAPEHEFTRETSGRMVRAVCSCGEWVGTWRSARAYLVETSLHSDEGGHLYAVRRAEALAALADDPWGDVGPVHHPTRFDLPVSADPPF